MNRTDEIIEEALRSAEPAIAEDGFCERVLARLPRTRRRIDALLARRLSLVGAAAIGCLATLVLGAPVDRLFANYLEFGEGIATLLEAAVVLGVLIAPIVWLMVSESDR